jgi:hypothetical protein
MMRFGRTLVYAAVAMAGLVLAMAALVILRPDESTTSAGPLPTATPTKPTPNATPRDGNLGPVPSQTPTTTPNYDNPGFDRAALVFQIAQPTGPASKLRSKLPSSQTAPFILRLSDVVHGAFPRAGEVVVGGTELMVYDFNSAAPECAALTYYDLCVVERSKVGQATQHAAGTKVRLATKLQAPLPGVGVAHTTLVTPVAASASPPFVVGVGSSVNFPSTGFVTISHSQQAFSMTVGTEYFEYDNLTNPCGGFLVNQLCVFERALQPGNVQREHPAHDLSLSLPVYSFVDLHVQAQVKSNVGFRTAGSVVVYMVDGSNTIVGAELIDYNNAAAKIKTPASNELHVTTRGAFTGTMAPNAIQQHDAFSIVTAPDRSMICRARGSVGGINRSIGFWLNCYETTEPAGPPKMISPKQLNVPLTGQVLTLTGEVGDTSTLDGSIQIPGFCSNANHPGTNVSVWADFRLKGPSPTGKMTVLLDTIPPGSGQAPGCATGFPRGDASYAIYDRPASDPTGDADDDTDGDGCTDLEELQAAVTNGGLRDPWNPHDFFDATGDDVVSIADIAAVIAKFGLTQSDPGYDATRDRGPPLGPLAHNLSGPDGSVTVSDIAASVTQFGNNCLA